MYFAPTESDTLACARIQRYTCTYIQTTYVRIYIAWAVAGDLVPLARIKADPEIMSKPVPE